MSSILSSRFDSTVYSQIVSYITFLKSLDRTISPDAILYSLEHIVLIALLTISNAHVYGTFIFTIEYIALTALNFSGLESLEIVPVSGSIFVLFDE